MTDGSGDHTLPQPLDMFDVELQAADGVATMQRCARALANAGINIDAVNYSDLDGTPSLHLLVQDGPGAVRILMRDEVTEATCRPVLVYTLPNRPGTLALYAGALVDDGVPVDFIYQATAKGVVIAAPDLKAVRATFSAAASG
jgi:hypothetical protein